MVIDENPPIVTFSDDERQKLVSDGLPRGTFCLDWRKIQRGGGGDGSALTGSRERKLFSI